MILQHSNDDNFIQNSVKYSNNYEFDNAGDNCQYTMPQKLANSGILFRRRGYRFSKAAHLIASAANTITIIDAVQKRHFLGRW